MSLYFKSTKAYSLKSANNCLHAYIFPIEYLDFTLSVCMGFVVVGRGGGGILFLFFVLFCFSTLKHSTFVCQSQGKYFPILHTI